ncbi:unnamed protein product [Cylicostephanus goldi]|uniref:Uncharacterized protein n=1 Tax=Cylicostephanus goldi TaxID=71465 RepID=A0A3P6RX13_CYLGO|nr:unnamed protein product [Cylicostephanus goldi]
MQKRVPVGKLLRRMGFPIKYEFSRRRTRRS